MRCAIRRVQQLTPVAIVLVVGLAAAPLAFAQADLSVTAAQQTCNPCVGGTTVTILTTVTNGGPSPDASVKLQSYTPVFGTLPVDSSGQVSQGTLTGPFIDTSSMVYWWDDQVGVMIPNASATLSYQVVLDMVAPANPVFRINAPASIAGLMDFQLGLFGQTEDQWNVTANAAVVADNSANPHLGCHDLVGFPAGSIALIERGTCNFDVKVMNAQTAGATGAVMMNNNADQDIHSFRMSGTDFGDLVTIPLVMVSKQNGDILESHILSLGETVNATFGLEHPDVASWDISATSYTYAATNDPDCPDTFGCNQVVATWTVTSGGGPVPVAEFTWAPTTPTVGQTVTFTDQSTNTPTIWAWDFGDGATSTDQNPTHAYATAATYTASLTATNANGSSAPVTHSITVGGSLSGSYFVAAAGNAGGAGGSQWVTDVEINNQDTTALSYRFLWLPRDADNSNPTQSELFTLGPGMSVRYPNVLDSVFSQTGFGALGILSDSADAIVMSRTYNQSTTGTFGQSIEGLKSTQLIPANRRMRIVFMTENDAYRSNVGLLNGTNAPIDIQVARYDGDGNALGTTETHTLAAWSNTQLNQLFHAYAPVNVGYVDVWTDTANGAFAAYGSIVDNATGDPTTVMPDSVSLAKALAVDQYDFIAAAGNAGGTGGSQWVTDAELNNPGSTAMSYYLLWLPRDADNSNPTQSELFTLDPGKSVRYPNVLESVFTQTGFGALGILSDNPDAIVMSRTFNQSTAGTFGQSIEGLKSTQLIQTNQRMRIVFMTENDAYRSNLGLLNGTNAPIDIQVALYDGDGNALGSTQTVHLAAWSNTQLNRLFQPYMPVNVGYVDVRTETTGGAFAAYGSIVDNATGDPTTVMPQ